MAEYQEGQRMINSGCTSPTANDSNRYIRAGSWRYIFRRWPAAEGVRIFLNRAVGSGGGYRRKAALALKREEQTARKAYFYVIAINTLTPIAAQYPQNG